MYAGNAARIYNPRPDPAERGPPKRLTREETHIGEMVAASKKRIAWKFALGESDTIHEVVLVHSIMSYKKVVEFDGRQMHYSATFTAGDWRFMMILDGSNHVFEVRINDLESADVPKYDLAVERIPFRHWDVYRRRKQPISTASSYAQPNALPQQPSTFGTQRWGPSGMSAPPPPPEPVMRPGYYPPGGANNRSPDARSSSFGARPRRDSGQRNSFGDGGQRNSFGDGGQRNSFGDGGQRNSFGDGGQRNSFTGSQQYQPRLSGGNYGPPGAAAQSTSPPAAAAPSRAPPPKKQPEINLIDDFGPSVTVPAQALIFDPLASSKIVAQGGASPPQQSNARTASSPAFAPVYGATNAPVQPVPAPYVDPFANQTIPLKPTPAPMQFDQFAPPQQQQQRPSLTGVNGMYQPNNFQQPQQQQPQQRMASPVAPTGMQMGGYAQPMQPMVPSTQPGARAAVGVGGGNISQLMNPTDVNGFQQNTQVKTINIDAFAAMK
ncbi:hypothetical protein FI667_g1156, partial [Globisporangium splendens]